MSRVGKQILEIPAKTTVTVSDDVVTVAGPLGTLARSFRTDIATIVVADGKVSFNKKQDNKIGRALYGTYASHVKNMLAGVN